MIAFVRFSSLLSLVFLARETESATVVSQPPSPVRVLEGQPLKLEWTLSVQGTFRRLEFKLSEAVGALVEIQPSLSPFIEPEFEDRLNASLTGRNVTITFFSVNRTDSAKYEFQVFGSSGSISVSLRVIVEYPPSLKTRALNQVVLEGGPAINLTCTADGEPKPNINWTKVFANGSDSDVLFTGEQFILPSNRTSDGTYRCKASNGKGNDVNHTVNVTVNFKPERFVFMVKSSNENFCKGGIINITCSAVGKPMVHTYQLFKDGNPVHTSNNSVLFWSQEATAGGEIVYSCVANNTVATASTTKNITVNEGSVIEQLENVTAVEGTKAALNCVVTGIPVPSVSWLEVKTGNHSSQNPFVFANVSRKQAGEYICHARNPCGNDSKSGILTVIYPPEGVHLQVSEDTVCKGANIIFNCSAADANPMELTYHLYENNVMVSNSSSSSTGIWNRAMTIEGVFGYKCKVNNTVGTAMSSNVSVTVSVPPSIQPIDNEMVIEGGNVKLTCNASGFPAPTVYWVKTGTGDRFNGAELVFANINRSEAGEYTCVASTPCNTSTELAEVDVKYPPSLITRALNQVVLEGGPAINLTCTADGEPAPNITWTKVFANGSDSDVLFTGEQFILPNNRANDGTTYRCKASNGIGSGVNHTVNVTVNFKPEKFNFTVEAVKNGSLCKRDTVYITCSAVGKPSVHTYQVFEDGNLVHTSNTRELFLSHATATGGDVHYTCVANNTVAIANTTKNITVNEGSVIQQVENITAVERNHATLSCVVTGIPEPSVSWLEVKTSTRFFGNTLALTNVTREQAGDYICEANNTCGNDSKSGILTVNYPPEGVQLQVSEDTVCKGANVIFNCSVTDANPMELTYHLYENNVTIINSSNTGIWNRTLTTGGVLGYKCKVYNTIGTAMSENVTIIVNEPSSILPFTRKVITEGNSLTVMCNSSGIPPPTVFWVKTGHGERTNGADLIFRDIHRNHSGEYTCKANNPCGDASQSVEIDVQFKPEMVQLVASKTTVCQGETIFLNCSANSNPVARSYQLYRNGAMVHQVDIGGVWSQTMAAAGVFVYQCNVTNSIGTAMSENVSITVNEPATIRAVENSTLSEGQNLTLSCQVSGHPFPSVSWVKVVGGKRFNGSKLFLPNTSRDATGEYRCEASNLCSTDSGVAVVDVQYAPEITHISALQTLITGEMLTLDCTADGNPAPTITWTRLSNGNIVNMPLTVQGKEYEGDYRCTASNSIGTVTKVTSITVNHAPKITQISAPQILSRAGLLTLNCTADGNPAPTITWTRLSNDETVHMPLNVTGKIYEEGYRCNASNELGTVFRDTSITRGYCERGCKDPKECRVGLCRCPNGKTGDTCEENDQPKTSFVAGLEVTNLQFEKAYEDLENPKTKALIKRIEKALKDALRGTELIRVLVVSLRPGSVIADLELTFNESTYEDYLRERLLDATKENKLGDFQVKLVVGKFFPTDEPQTMECNQFFEGEDCKKGIPSHFVLFFVFALIIQTKHFEFIFI